MDNPDLDRQQIDLQGQEKTIGLHHRACSQRSERLHNRSSGLPKRQEPVIVAIASNLKKMIHPPCCQIGFPRCLHALVSPPSTP